MIAIVLRSRSLRDSALDAARRVQEPAESCALSALPELLRDRQPARCVVIHDFSPDPASSLALLRMQRETGRVLAVLALLEAPATPKLDLLLPASGPLGLAGVVIASEEGTEGLADRMRAALARAGRQALLEILVTSWRLDPVLERVAAVELRAERPHTTLEGLLREARVGRKRFVRVARGRGVSPPLRFLQGLRVMEAADLLQQGCTARRAAERLGYGSLDTLRTHFRTMAGITPRAARARTLGELAGVVAGGWGGRSEKSSSS
jgi:AraC-like DNA-binding protein